MMMLVTLLWLFSSGMTTLGLTVYGVIPFCGLSHLTEPVYASFASRELPVEEQGRLQGAISAVGTLAQCLGPLIATYVMHRTMHSAVPSAVYLAAAAISLPGVAMAWCVRPKVARQSAVSDKDEDSSSSE